jgi:hypothetical protein
MMTPSPKTHLEATSVRTNEHNRVQKVCRIAVPLVLALMIFAVAGFVGTNKASANATCGSFVQKNSASVLADDGSKVVGTLSIWVNTCSNQAYAKISCAIATDFIQSSVQDLKAPGQPMFWSASPACTPGQSVSSPVSTYTATQTCASGYIGDSYIFEQDNASNEGTGWVCA